MGLLRFLGFRLARDLLAKVHGEGLSVDKLVRPLSKNLPRIPPLSLVLEKDHFGD